MVNKLVGFLVWTIFIVVIFGILWILVEPIIWWTQYSEVRLCVRLFLIMFALNTFAVLRLYNSIVQNTRFSIKLRESQNKIVGVVPTLERAIKNLTNVLSGVRVSTDSLKKELNDNTDKVIQLTDKVKQSNIKK